MLFFNQRIINDVFSSEFLIDILFILQKINNKEKHIICKL